MKVQSTFRVRSVNSESFISDINSLKQDKTKSDPNMKLSLFAERTLNKKLFVTLICNKRLIYGVVIHEINK